MNLAENDSSKEEEWGSRWGDWQSWGRRGAIIKEIAEVLERTQKDKLSALRDVPKKKLLEETAKVDKTLCKFKPHSITKTN